MRLHETIKKDNGEIKVYGSNKHIMVCYARPEWSEYQEPYFRFKGNRYYLSEFLNAGDIFPGYDGYSSDSYFSGVVIKIYDGGDTVKAFTYIT